MAGTAIITDLGLEKTVDLVVRAAEHKGFAVHDIADDEVRLQKGNLAMSILLGAIIAYCNFTVHFKKLRGDDVEILLERNRPWWTGWIGLIRVKNHAKALVEEILDELEDVGGAIIRHEDF